MVTTKINVKGREWEARLLTRRKYEKLHGADSGAITIMSTKQIDFNKSDLNPEDVRHEVFHAYVKESNTESANLTADQMEELCCSLVGEYAIEIIKSADYIISKFI